MKKLYLGLLLALSLLSWAPVTQAASTDPIQQGSVGLEGTVPTTPPTTGATISFPTNGQTFTSLPINVTGICPDGLLVKLFKNGVFAGSTQCDGSFTITTDLFSGQNELIARVYDALDQAGPDSNKVTVTFNDTSFGAQGSRVTLTSNFAKRGANPSETLTWPIVISGGTAPYAVSVDWGDGETQLISQAIPGAFDIQHVYNAPGIFNILIKASDATGATAFLQVVGVANGPLSQENTAAEEGAIIRTIIIWWPLLIAVPMLLISFFLGRRHQLQTLKQQMEDRIHY